MPISFSKNDIGMGIHMIIHYNCTIGSILLHSFLLICHPYPPSFYEMIFTLVPLIFLFVEASQERQGAPKMAMASFRRECWQFVAIYLGVLTGKYKDSVGQKAHRLSAWSIYVKTTGAACVSVDRRRRRR